MNIVNVPYLYVSYSIYYVLWMGYPIMTMGCLVKLLKWALIAAHHWQKWKSIFLTCPRQKVYRVEAVGLKSSNYV